MSADKLRGLRLLVSVVDEYAKDSPSRVWAVVPLDEGNLAKGFKDITYFTLANAVNHAASWLQKVLPPPGAPFETVAYAGPKDIRYPVLAIAAAKVGRKVCYNTAHSTLHRLMAVSFCCRHHMRLLQPRLIFWLHQIVEHIFTRHRLRRPSIM